MKVWPLCTGRQAAMLPLGCFSQPQHDAICHHLEVVVNEHWAPPARHPRQKRKAPPKHLPPNEKTINKTQRPIVITTPDPLNGVINLFICMTLK